MAANVTPKFEVVLEQGKMPSRVRNWILFKEDTEIEFENLHIWEGSEQITENMTAKFQVNRNSERWLSTKNCEIGFCLG